MLIHNMVAHKNNVTHLLIYSFIKQYVTIEPEALNRLNKLLVLANDLNKGTRRKLSKCRDYTN